MDTRFARTKGGKMIHLTECRHAKNGVPWGWADTVADDIFLRRVADDLGLTRCHCCDPLDEGGVMDTPNWEGAHNPDRHRTLGPHRAWCACGYCYPDDWCDCCHEAAGHRKVWIDFDGDVVGVE